MQALFLYHWKLYFFFIVSVYIPQLILIFYPSINLPGLGLAFVGVVLMTKLMTIQDKDYLAMARSLALESLKNEYKRSPSKSEIESLAHKIVESRLFTFYFCGALALALGLVANATS